MMMNSGSVNELNFIGCAHSQNLIFECTTLGGVATVWKGRGIDCQGSKNEIIFLHSRFNKSLEHRTCNDGAIIGQAVRVENNSCYTSQLFVNAKLYNGVIECIHDEGTNESSVGNVSGKL